MSKAPNHEQLRAANLLGALALALTDAMRDDTESVAGASGATAAALTTIAQYPGGTIQELAQTLGLTHPAAVRAVDRLAAQGLVVRNPRGGGPALALTVTAAGSRRAGEVLAARGRAVHQAVGKDGNLAGISSFLEECLRRLTVDAAAGDRICRLCDTGVCPQERCPVAERQRLLGAPPPEPTHVAPA